MKFTSGQILLPLCGALCLFPFMDPALALALGVGCALFIQNPYQDITARLPKTLLPLCVIGLGAAMNLHEVAKAGVSGFGYTAISIALTMLAGLALGRAFKTERQASWLISVGTAICGGSAIAALAPVLNARHGAIAVSLAVVFVLNAVALLIFPPIGHWLDLTQHQFGLWSALAIHDTSSVVGAGLKYGTEALQTGTSVKLARALWIVPLVLLVQAMYKHEGEHQTQTKRKYPWFILGFLALAALVTYFPVLKPAGEWVAFAARRGLILTLFLIGTNLHKEVIIEAGVKPFAQGIALWLIVSVLSVFAIYQGWIS